MLQVFGFERIAIAVGDLYFLDPRPRPGEEGAEQGVRLEVRFLERGELKGSIYSAQPIAVDLPIWRVDLLEAVTNPGSFDRTHHHPGFHGWNPTGRHFVAELTADPLGWVKQRLADLGSVLDEAGVPAGAVEPRDVVAVRDAVPEIMGVVERLLDGVRAGRLGQPPLEGADDQARAGWL